MKTVKQCEIIELRLFSTLSREPCDDAPTAHDRLARALFVPLSWLFFLVAYFPSPPPPPPFLYLFGLNKMYSFIVSISSTNKYRKHKSSMRI